MTAPVRLLAAFLLGLASAGPASAQAVPGPALEIINAYLARAAESDPADRADVKLGDPPRLSAGRFAAYSPLLGDFSYRPKTYDELSRADRAALLRDPAFHAFLAARRRPGSPEAGAGSPATLPGRPWQFSVTAEEMLGIQAVRVAVPSP